MDVICQECCLDASKPTVVSVMQLESREKTYMVYSTTPIGSKKQAAAVGTPVRLDATALPPVNNIAVTCELSELVTGVE